MTNKRTILSLLTLLLLFTFTSCDDNFISDSKYRKQVHEDFLLRKELAQNRHKQLFAIMETDITEDERQALEFLYAYMPYSDLADYDGEFFLNQVKGAFRAKYFFNWGNKIPEDIFRHFVLVYRVNNENLDEARDVIFEELKDRIKDMSMYEAALEVNHWCHEKVTYRPSDSRTSSPLATIKTGYGRCGEESTFTVSAMRAVGIPARQCYTPRWAHTDDNHAWVEVWVDGKWYFLGACEPEPELNMGWFAIPSTKAMMVHSNAYGKYKGKEEVNYKSELFSRVNMLPNYTNTKKIKVYVEDTNGNKIKDAKVKYKLYNYAEYYPIATGTTNDKGYAEVTTGLGDLLIWVQKEGKYNYKKIDVRKQDEIIIELACEYKNNVNENSKATSCIDGNEYVLELDMYPPVGRKQKKEVEQKKIKENNKRLLYEDSVRNAYLNTFPTSEEIKKNIKSDILSSEKIEHFITKSEGNYKEIETFIKDNNKKVRGLFLDEFLSSLSEKDLRDMPATVLQSHLELFSKQICPEDVFIKGLLPARIANEYIRPWRQYLNEKMSMEIVGELSYNKIVKWINENIEISRDGNYYNCPISPRGVYELRHSDKHSRNIFFVAACRALGIPAYRDNATGKLYAYENKQWNAVSFETERVVNNSSTLILNYNDNTEIQPQYWIHYTIAKFNDGDFYSFDYENDPRVANFPVKLNLEPGYYMLSTGNRYSDGTTLSRLEFFSLEDGQSLEKEIVMRPLTPRNEYYGEISLDLTLNIDGANTTIKEFMDDKPLVISFINPTQEPTKHLLNDIVAYKDAFDKWGGKMLYVIPSDKNTGAFKLSDWNMPENTSLMIDENAKLMKDILISTNQEFRDNYPLVFIVQTDGKLNFKTEAYRIGTGELIFRTLAEKK